MCIGAFDGFDLWLLFSHANHLRWRICLVMHPRVRSDFSNALIAVLDIANKFRHSAGGPLAKVRLGTIRPAIDASHV